MKIDPTKLRARIDALAVKRHQAVDVALELARLELRRTALRRQIVDELVTSGVKATPADEAARTEPRYLAAGEEIAQRQADHGHLHADAEKLRLEIDLGTALLRARDVELAA